MYHVFYPDPTENTGSGGTDSYLHETAETEEEAIELGERAAASWRGLDREEIMIFGSGHGISLPDEPDGHRCPHCGRKVDVSKFGTGAATEKDFDPTQGQYMLSMECPECGETVCAWFDGDPGDGLEFDRIDEYSGDSFSNTRDDTGPDGIDDWEE